MIDAYTDTWRAVAAKANEMIEACRARLEQNDQSYGESQFLRGRITAMREILEMAKPAVIKTGTVPQDFRSRDRSGV
jgi:threonine aldolase